MVNDRPVRYGDVAVGLHWLVAILIFSLLAIGKYMTGLDDNDPQRFLLTQWHKSFGIMVLLLSVVRLLWRVTHKAPGHPVAAPAWEKAAASVTHGAIYLLIFAVPLSGWILVSASPLNIDTLLFNVIPWPHLPPFENLPGKEAVAEAFSGYHELAGNALLALLILHVGAAFKHHLIDRDDVLTRMAPDWSSQGFRRQLRWFSLAVVAFAVGLWQYAGINSGDPALQAGSSQVTFVANVAGADTLGVFAESDVSATLDNSDSANSKIIARVQTATISTDNPQVNGSLPDKDWFDVQAYPQASFESTLIEASAENAYIVSGNFTLKGITQPVSFVMQLDNTDGKQVASGTFTIKRLDFNVGKQSQPNDDNVGLEIEIRFQFDIAAE